MKYHKIVTVFKRNPETKFRTLLEGDWATPEFEYLKNNKWIFTEKVDGTNIRVMWDNDKVRFGGRTDRAQIPAFLIDRLQDLFPSEKLAECWPHHLSDDELRVCLYGEGYGAKIQKGGGNYKSDGCDFVLFDVSVDGVWLRRGSVEDIAEKLGIEAVPVVYEGTLFDMVDIVRNGFTSEWGEFQVEGVVGRPSVEMKNRIGSRVITKLKCRDFPTKEAS